MKKILKKIFIVLLFIAISYSFANSYNNKNNNSYRQYIIGDLYIKVENKLNKIKFGKRYNTFNKLIIKIDIIIKKKYTKIKKINKKINLNNNTFNIINLEKEKKVLEKKISMYKELLDIIKLKLEPKETEVFKNIHYGDYDLNTLDIYSTPKASAPIIIYVHGGGWKLGDKDSGKDKGEYFSKKGYNFVSLNYRLYPDVGYEKQLNDIAKAFSFIYINAIEFNGNKDNIILMGHSAGGHLVSMLSTNETYLKKENLNLKNIDATILLDSAGLNIPLIKKLNKKIFNFVYKKIFGENEISLLKASPINYIKMGKNIPTFYIYYSTKRPKNHEYVTRNFYNKLLDNKITATIEGFNYSHKEMNDNIGINGEKLTLSILNKINNLYKK